MEGNTQNLQCDDNEDKRRSKNVHLPLQCVIIQKRQAIVPPQRVPQFLHVDGDKTACQQHGSGHETLQCGNTDVYIKSECVCTFYNVNEAKYHDHTACPNGENSDDVKRLTCRECALFSLHNKGPCINGGNLTCKTGENVLAPDIQCDCPDDFEGMFCENRMENVTRICDMVTEPSSPQLINCDLTKMDCFTYSENKKYAFKCNKTEESQERKGLPLCSEIESVIIHTIGKTTTESGNVRVESNNTRHGYTPRADKLTPVLTLTSVYCWFLNIKTFAETLLLRV